LLFLLLAQWPVIAQNDTLVQLPTVEVSASSLHTDLPGSYAEKWSAEDKKGQSGRSVANFLQNKTGIYFKTYGAGSLATASIRGASASQTAVLWNGFQVQSPMLGLLDWSLLPMSFSDEISLQHGGNSAVWGSGAIGGSVLMENKPDFDTKSQVNLEMGLGSFGWKNGEVTAKFANQKFATATRIFYLSAKNDFAYSPAPGLPEKRQTNAGQQQSGLLQEFYWRPSGKYLLGWQTWAQRAYREIPPTTTQTRSTANQADEALRTALSFHWHHRENRVEAKSALFRESIHYRDPQTGQDAPSHFWTSISEVEWRRFLSNHFTLQFAGNQTFTKAFIKNYQPSAERLQSAIFASMRYTNRKWSAQLDGRYELVDGRFVPFTPSIGLERRLKDWLKISGKFGRNYRLPTLNDLHWIPGGNPDLLAESGWSSEVNTELSLKTNLLSVQFSSAAFNRNIKNWILWHPTSGQPFWSASNIAAVWSRGLENRAHLAFGLTAWRFKLDMGYDLIHSANQKAVTLPKIEAGQQLIYVPVNQGFMGVEIRYKELGVAYRHHYTGSVLTELGSLPSFQTGSCSVDFEQSIRNIPVRCFLQIDNCWDANYRVIERRPMPGRSIQLGFSINFTKN